MRNTIAAVLILFFLASCDEQSVDNPPPSTYQLKQNFPNPFSDTTVIEYGVPVVGNSTGPHLRVAVFDRYYDRQVVLLDSINHPAGTFRLYWKPYQKNPAGLYYIELQQITHSFLFSSSETLKRIVTIKK